jgi:hypothetical protein
MKVLAHGAPVSKCAIVGTLIVFGSLIAGGSCYGAGEEPSANPPSAGSLETFERLHRTIKPGKGEWKYASLPWASTVAEARELAAAQGKPMFIWYMVGEPLGQC